MIDPSRQPRNAEGPDRDNDHMQADNQPPLKPAMTTQQQLGEDDQHSPQDRGHAESIHEQQHHTHESTFSEPLHVCVACGFCCDGTLFDRVEVSSKEKERLQDKGKFYTRSNGEIRMRLGCQYLGSDGRCECYQKRPRKCRSYQCELLKSVEAGITSMQDAVNIVREARMLRDKSIEASHAAVRAGGGTIAGTENVNQLIRQVEELLNLSAPVPAPAVALAKYRYRSFVHWIRLYIRNNHLH